METVRALLLSTYFGGPYAVFAAILVGCSIGIPFSADLTMLTAGILAGTGFLDLRTAILIAYFSIIGGDSINFFVSRKYGHKIVQSKVFRTLCTEERFEEISRFLNNNAAKFIFFVRFTPAGRAISFITAGTVQVKPAIFYRSNILSTAIYVPSLMTMAYLGANHADEMVAQFQSYSRSILLVLATAVFGVVYYRRRVKNATERR